MEHLTFSSVFYSFVILILILDQQVLNKSKIFKALQF